MKLSLILTAPSDFYQILSAEIKFVTEGLVNIDVTATHIPARATIGSIEDSAFWLGSIGHEGNDER